MTVVATMANGSRWRSAVEGLQANMKYVSLVLLTVQNAALVLVMRHARSRPVTTMFLATTGVIMAELIKLVACLLIIFVEESFSFRRLLAHLNENILQQPLDCVKISLPSLIYVLQNNLLYVAVSNLAAATFQVSYQLKILTTAVFSVLILGKEVSRPQWFSLLMLFVGVAIVQLEESHGATGGDTTSGQSAVAGLTAVATACLMSGFAGVYFEMVLKSTKQSVWVRNVQLGFLGVVIGLATMFIKDREVVSRQGFFAGYDAVVWVVVLLNSLGGLVVAVVVKYADNILKGFATSAAIVLSCVLSVYLFDFRLSVGFTVGAALVVAAVFMYSKYIVVKKVEPVLPVIVK